MLIKWLWQTLHFQLCEIFFFYRGYKVHCQFNISFY